MRKPIPQKSATTVTTTRVGPVVQIILDGVVVASAPVAQAAQWEALLNGLQLHVEFGEVIEEFLAQAVVKKSGWNNPTDGQLEAEDVRDTKTLRTEEATAETTPPPTLTARVTSTVQRAATWLIS